MTDKIGSLILDVEGYTLTQEDRELLTHPLVGGVILFTRNYESREQLQALCSDIRAARPVPLLITVDQEGGRVQRFIPEFTKLPSMGSLGRLFDENPSLARRVSESVGWLMATELLTVGVDLSFAPVLDLNNKISTVIGERGFHGSPQTVVQLASAFIQGMREAGMASVGKHFPGHGSIQLDSHLAMPIDNRTLQVIEQQDLIPFAGLIKSGISGMMCAHIVFPHVDSRPVGFSSIWLKDILRARLGFIGTIFSDDLNMEGANISTNYADRVVAAREAGCDFTLLCNNRAAVIHVLDNLAFDKYMVGKDKWGVLQGKFNGVPHDWADGPRWRETHQLLLEHMATV